MLADLEQSKAVARETRRPELLDAGGVLLQVSGTSLNRYPFRLEHQHGLLGLTTSAALPTVQVQPRAAFLHAVGVEAALSWWRDLVELLLGAVEWKVSRLDVYMDSQGWLLSSEDRAAFVARSAQTVMYENDAEMQTLMFGSAKSPVKARIYDKTAEIAKKGTDWWPSVWGDAYRPGTRVLRVEFQVGRQVLKECGIDKPEQALEHAPELWGYLTEKWLSCRIPTEDETRSRWPVAAEWQQVQQASLRGGAVGLDRVRAGAVAGDLRRIMPALRGYVARAAPCWERRTSNRR
ncbi:hypothetical protein [Nocardioides daphniae]|uniref:Replication-associated protein G2P N-terminal domain-containing protein n=1 Tax=Nocardioides daphniae TaxID=402297 RepID=A0A4P7UCI0_9ACTN|nr:hypothetical protein [Nocardioides daphniae]QCC77494.1 hypothetical protein E2C04_10480 [Nocardioides daphniae]